MNTAARNRRIHFILLISFGLIFIWSAINPTDYRSWFMEVGPVILALGFLLATYNRFRLTNLSYFLAWTAAVIILVGGHYTYSEMPLFNWLQLRFGLERNHYDRFGHFFQGILPAILVREALLRRTNIRRGWGLFFICVTISLGLSAAYELVEWVSAEAFSAHAEDFLARQGDEWDAQWDMFMALCGSILTILVLDRTHDENLEEINPDYF